MVLATSQGGGGLRRLDGGGIEATKIDKSGIWNGMAVERRERGKRSVNGQTQA
jgi:hypothetical protein